MEQTDNEMSFSQNVKVGLFKSLPNKKCCRRALLYGLLIFHKRLPDGAIVITNGNNSVLKGYSKLLSEYCNIPYNKDNIPTSITVSRMKLGMLFDNTKTEIDDNFFECEYCRRYFLAGIFSERGTVSNPEKGYRLELVFDEPWSTRLVYDFLCSVSLEPKRTERSGKYLLYYKATESIEDFLNYICAQKASFDVMNARIEKELRNNANRVVNCDSYNLTRATETGKNQAELIKKLSDTGRLGSLPEQLRQTAMLRLEFPELSLTELAAAHNPPISKSGLNHRLIKLCELVSEDK